MKGILIEEQLTIPLKQFKSFINQYFGELNLLIPQTADRHHIKLFSRCFYYCVCHFYTLNNKHMQKIVFLIIKVEAEIYLDYNKDCFEI